MKSDDLLNSKDSNPEKMGWMQGFPPPESKTIYANDSSFYKFPALRYSVNHIRELYPTREVKASKFPYSFVTNIDDNIDKIQFIPWNEQKPITWKESLEKNYVDGIIILHKGTVLYEKYPAGLKIDGIHAAMSVSKSFTGTLAAILINDGTIDPNKLVTDYIPELHYSGFENATVQQVLDMTTAIEYSEDYTDPNAEIWKFSASGNVFRDENYIGPKNYYDYLKTIKKIPNQAHGEVFGYKTVNTELMAWIISRVTGKCITELISEKIWQPMGANYDGYYQVGTGGIAYAGGGFNTNLRDMALFGEVLRNNGNIKNQRNHTTDNSDINVIPSSVIKTISQGGCKIAFEKSGEYPLLKNWSYHNMWWITNNDLGAFMARGVHGQAIYIAPKAQMVIARFASNPLASNKYIDPISIPAYEAIANYLMNK